jgi:hypothetical protein
MNKIILSLNIIILCVLFPLFSSHPLGVKLNELGSSSPERVLLVVESGSEAWGVVVGKILPVSWVDGVNFLGWLGSVSLLSWGSILGGSSGWWVLLGLSGELFLLFFLFFFLGFLYWFKISLLGFWVWLLDWSSLGFGFSIFLGLLWEGLGLIHVLLNLLWSWVWCFWFLWWTGSSWRWNISALWSFLNSPVGSWVDHLVDFDPDIWSNFVVGDVSSGGRLLSISWWEGFWTGSVIIVLLVVSSGSWKNINLIASELVDVWLHTGLSNISLANFVSSGIKRSWEG